MIALLLAAALNMPGDNPRVSIALYAFTAASDEITSVGKTERGMVKHQGQRIALKAALLPVYVIVTHKASKSPKRWVRIVGKVGRFAVPAGYLAGTFHNLRVK